MRVIVNVGLKDGVLDPQGKAVKHALNSLGFSNVNDVKISKQIFIETDFTDKELAKKEVEKMCEELLANTVIENYEIIL